MANLVVFEDLLFTRMEIHEALEGSKHIVVAEATNMKETYELLASLEAGEVEADGALVDGNLDKQQTTYWSKRDGLFVPPDPGYQRKGERHPTSSGRDGRQILNIIRTCNIELFTISISDEHPDEWGGCVGAVLPKHNIMSGLLPLLVQFEGKKQIDKKHNLFS